MSIEGKKEVAQEILYLIKRQNHNNYYSNRHKRQFEQKKLKSK